MDDELDQAVIFQAVATAMTGMNENIASLATSLGQLVARLADFKTRLEKLEEDAHYQWTRDAD